MRALRELQPEQHASERVFVPDEALWGERRCQGPAALSALNNPVNAPPKQRRIVAVGDAPICKVNSVEKPRKLRLEGGFQHVRASFGEAWLGGSACLHRY